MDSESSSPHSLLNTQNNQIEPHVLKSKKSPLFFILVCILLILMTIPLFGLFYLLFTQRIIFIPMSGNQEEIFSYGISYTFTANVSKIIDSPEGRQVITYSRLQNLPKILVSPKTDVFYIDEAGETFVQTSPSSIAPNQKIMVNLYYHLTKKQWLTTRINIFWNPPGTQSPSVSPIGTDTR